MEYEERLELQSLTKQFYETTERGRRREILDRMIQLEGETEENLLRRSIMDGRYAEKNGQELDYFIRGWMILTSLRSQFWGKRSMRKDAREALECWQMDRAADETGRRAIGGELYNMTRLYIELCGSDRNYNSYLWGLGRISEERRNSKIEEELVRQTETIPEKLGMREEFALFRESAQRAYNDMFPSREKLGS